MVKIMWLTTLKQIISLKLHVLEEVLAGYETAPAKASHDCGKHVHPQ